MVEVTIWKTISIFPIVGFFGIFTLASLLLNWIRESLPHSTTIVFLVLTTSLTIALFFWGSAAIHNHIGMSKIDTDLSAADLSITDLFHTNYGASFFMFSIAWHLILIVLSSSLAAIYRSGSLKIRRS